MEQAGRTLQSVFCNEILLCFMHYGIALEDLEEKLLLKKDQCDSLALLQNSDY